MSSYQYTLGIPATADDPSVDQPYMKINNDSISGIFGQDHVGFNQALGGVHQQARIQALNTIPINTSSGMGTIYTKQGSLNGVIGTSETTLFYNPDSTNNEYQLTRTIAAYGALFGKNIIYLPAPIPAPTSYTGGWTFLPGGILLQYGVVDTAAANTNYKIFYPVPFTSGVYVLTGNPQSTNFGFNTGDLLTYFNFINTSSSAIPIVYWVAIGV